MSRLITGIIPLFFTLLVLLSACNGTNQIEGKVSSSLLAQVGLRKAQMESPTPERLETMKKMGMRVDNLQTQRIFIHLREKLSPARAGELTSLGLVLYLDSWLPPVGAHETGFLLADMPVDKLEGLVGKDYIVRLDTAERLAEPQADIQPQ